MRSGAGSKTGTNMFDCMGFVKPILADASFSKNETTEKEGVEWETGASAHRGDIFCDHRDRRSRKISVGLITFSENNAEIHVLSESFPH